MTNLQKRPRIGNVTRIKHPNLATNILGQRQILEVVIQQSDDFEAFVLEQNVHIGTRSRDNFR